MSEFCPNCGKEKLSGKAGSMTSYFFEHKYCHCERRRQKELRLSRKVTAPAKSQRLCLTCGKSRPEEQKAGSFTAFLFKELRCQCSRPKFAAAENKRTQVADRIKQKRQTARSKIQSLRGESGPIPIGPGTIIGGTFKIASIIGEGGMGTVYLAQHRTLPQKFAVKILAQSLVSEQYWQRFQAEAKTLAALKHPNLVNVFDLGIHENSVFYYSMDYLDGRNLEDILADDGPQTLERTIEIFLAVLDGLAYAHRNGIVHRDIKPANIFICNKGTSGAEVKILDFGIAKLVTGDNTGQELTAVGEIFGSPYYMSPEQCLGNAVDARSDIYSVGCSLFETLTGFVPFEADSSLAIALMHEEDAPPLLADVMSNQLPTSVDTVIAKCLAKNPRDRYQSAKELAIDLERIRDGKDVAAYGRPRAKYAEDRLEIEEAFNSKTLIIVLFSALLFTGVAGLALWNSFYKPTEKPIKKALRFYDENAVLSDRVIRDNALVIQPSTRMKIDTYLNGQPNNYSRLINVQGTKKKQFSFPTSFSLGLLSDLSEKQERESQGIVVFKENCQLKLDANDNVAQVPKLLQYFQKDDLYAFTLATGTTNNDDLMRYLSDLTSLQVLHLPFAELAKRDFAYLDKLKNLSELKIELPDDGEAFGKTEILTKLQRLSVASPHNISPVINTLARSNSLLTLSLSHVSLTDQDCKKIATIRNLQEIALYSVNFSDQELEHLSATKELKVFYISNAKGLTPACRKSLMKMKKLTLLVLPFGLLTDAQINELKKSNPKLTFKVGSSTLEWQ